jgi:hypothetical protein
MLSRLYTSHYRYSGPDRVDITVKGQDPRWKVFAPTWEMVMGVKNGTMSEAEYIKRYVATLARVRDSTWDTLLQMEEATFVCFCLKDWFCHRNILIHHIVESLGERVAYLGWRPPT